MKCIHVLKAIGLAYGNYQISIFYWTIVKSKAAIALAQYLPVKLVRLYWWANNRGDHLIIDRSVGDERL